MTIRASGVAFDGRIKTLGASPAWETRVIVDFDLVESGPAAEAAVEGFVDRVLAMVVSAQVMLSQTQLTRLMQLIRPFAAA